MCVSTFVCALDLDTDKLYIIIVYFFAEKPHLDVRVAPLSIESGGPFRLYRQVQLMCDILTSPPMDTSGIAQCGWSFDHSNTFLSTNGRFTVRMVPTWGTVNHIHSTLTIHGITPNELGTYTCEARNGAGLYAAASIKVLLGKMIL